MLRRYMMAALMMVACSTLYSQVLPMDKLVHYGKLPNGLTYYIRKNTEPNKRAEMILVVNAGSILEEDNQRGLAHFMEHMSFNGTAHFPKNELIHFLQRSGVRFGADLNANTGFDQTVYSFPIPTDSPALFRSGVQILRDWAGAATLDPVEIDKERGVVLEEKRLGKGFQGRLNEKALPLYLNGARYADRLPIGTDTVLNNFKPPVLASFYKDWYRPDLEAVIIVGDIDVAATEAMVRKTFSDLRNPVHERWRTNYAVPLTGSNHFLAFTDPECTNTSLSVLFKFKRDTIRTEKEYLGRLEGILFAIMLSERVNNLNLQPSPPFKSVGAGPGEFLGGLSAMNLQLEPKEGHIQEGFDAMWTEIYRIRKQGFTQPELDRAKETIRRSIEERLKEKDKQVSGGLAEAYQRHFAVGDIPISLEEDSALTGKYLEGVTLAQVNKVADRSFKETDRDITITAPAALKDSLPDEGAVSHWIAAVEAAPVKSYKEDQVATSLLEKQPLPGKVVKEKKLSAIDATEWTLSNGARVVLKSTNFKNDEVLFSAYSPGGTSLYPYEDFESATNGCGILGSMGLGDYDLITLQRLLNGKLANVGPYVAEREEGISGSASTKDLLTAFELIYLRFTAPRKDTAIFHSIIQSSGEYITGRYKDPNNVFADTVNYLLGGYNIRRAGPTEKMLEAIDLDQSLRIYKERFGNAEDFTFFFVGSFNPDSLRSLVEKYIGSLPSTGVHETAKDLDIHIPEGHISKTVVAGKEDKATVRLIFSGTYDFNVRNNLTLDALSTILGYRITDRLREDESGAYSPSVQVSKEKDPRGRYAFFINFGCGSANIEKLISAAQDEISKLQKDGISATDLQKFKAESKRSREVYAKLNGFWLFYLSEQYKNGGDLNEFFSADERMDQLNLHDLQSAAQHYLDGKNYIRAVLLPEGK